jgi:glycosyltransferase involved in cell wall biosynthesis
MSQSIIFHHPVPINDSGISGSQVRPYQMLKGFRELGIEIEEIAGYAKERKKKIYRILRELQEGRTFSFLYSESHALPTLLTETHHIPTHPNLDFGFFSQLKKYDVPVGLFYRDIYWRFELYRKYSLYKRLIAIPMYYYDWWRYKKTVNHLFLPSLAMRSHLPSPWPDECLSALPPGSEIHESPQLPEVSSPLNLLYVGGVLPPLYDLRPAFDYLRNLQNVTITICCRKDEWETVKSFYRLDNSHIKVVHASGKGLEELYRNADLFFILRQSHEYLNFAMPVKVFETISYGIPIITLGGNETARFVQNEKIGWITSSKDEFVGLIQRLQNYPNTLIEMKEHVRLTRLKHTWQARAEQVANTLMNLNL